MMVRIIYAFFLGLLLVLFVGMGIQAFYPAPKYPEYPEILSKSERPVLTPTASPDETPEQRVAREEYDRLQKDYKEVSNTYNRNVSIIALGFAVLLLIISLVFVHKIDVIADGLLLGGIFNMLYSIGRGFATDDSKYQFIIVTIGLVIAFILGYLKFIAPTKKTEHKT